MTLVKCEKSLSTHEVLGNKVLAIFEFCELSIALGCKTWTGDITILCTVIPSAGHTENQGTGSFSEHWSVKQGVVMGMWPAILKNLCATSAQIWGCLVWMRPLFGSLFHQIFPFWRFYKFVPGAAFMLGFSERMGKNPSRQARMVVALTSPRTCDIVVKLPDVNMKCCHCSPMFSS